MLFFIFILGLFIGSFLGVIIMRYPKGKSFFTDRSECDKCKHKLGPVDLIPLFSFLSTFGRCRYCKTKLSNFYPFIELLTGIMFVGVYHYIFGNSNIYDVRSVVVLISLLALTGGLIVISLIDWFEGIIPVPILVFTYLFSFLIMIIGAPNPINNLISGVCVGLFFLAVYLITKRKGIGFGDVLLAPLMGLLMGFPLVIVSLYAAFLTGAVVSIILILIGKKKLRGSTIALGPFLILGIYVALFWGEYLIARFLPFLNYL